MVSIKDFITKQLNLPDSAVETVAAPPPLSPGIPGARVTPRNEHNVSRRQISEGALQVLNGLHRAGFQAYLVGGSVRDLLLGREPKDFDVATDAHPEQVRKLFRRNARLIGRRFILVHVQFGHEIIEVATFRGGANGKANEASERSETGRILADNVYGSLEEDARRRDFTANALYYNIADRSILDFSTGMEDLQAGRLRVIGDPEQRYREDPVRMLRAVRFAAKLGFIMDTAAQAPIAACRERLQEVPSARLFEETLKLFLNGNAQTSFEHLRQQGLFAALFPQVDVLLDHAEYSAARTLLQGALGGTDTRVRDGKSVTPAFLFAALLWPALQEQCRLLEQQGKPATVALQQAASDVLQECVGRVSVPRRFALPMREIWDLQARFMRRGGRRPHALLAHPRFRAAFDFLSLRSQSGEISATLVEWWEQFQTADHDGRRILIERARLEETGQEAALGPLPATSRRRPRRRRRRGNRPGQGGADDSHDDGQTDSD
ncbi:MULTISPECIES: polynucleotide adenylyltransferase PcnB [Acidithiobacillus]|uniref:Poly(A) polymerase I n=3 Tax=Acidithiobacillus TaxID=119977 RepID=A0A179BM51_ACIFR|nr:MULTISPECIES: polynucleotide adenylyltransferase PcnB [Acidithiobacillus]MDA8152041.1 polynucleotide adenylyltransferase PcnB [Acidithiobacillus sp.]MBU2829044.1 polynucleotide adenylyltransferase PcnB [Acidithiobacillus ferriphilus]MBU2831825.1 polynucleotide adenylyltransferase PcnB [Acidithiobacillus ferriphilus]MBU2844607.1 polynucleotide adenylyltransferase PcnB [Acidithiobacillus ferriphilus]MBU2854436.1 polynucleotide adenylyltransferase PcnB [Acidithiobacillus ferriphilus]